MPGCPGISAARCSAWLALRDGRWELSSAGPLEEGEDAEHGAHAAGRTCLWGRLTAEVTTAYLATDLPSHPGAGNRLRAAYRLVPALIPG